MSVESGMIAKSILCGAAALAAVCAVTAAECADGTCPIAVSNEEAVAVLTPVPASAVTPVRQGERLKTLDGKTIALVGGSFMANVTHPELKRLILAEHPSAKVYLLSEIGSAGPYPRPGVVRRETDEFRRKLKEFGIDAVVAGNGGCGLCTPKETGSCIAAEVMGIPSVMIAARGFVTEARRTAGEAGVGTLRVAEYPGAFASDTRETLIKNTREILWPQIKQGLTEPISAVEGKIGPAGVNDVEQFDSFAEFQRVFADSGWTDGLPILPPTERAVAEFLSFTDRSPDTSLGAIPPPPSAR